MTVNDVLDGHVVLDIECLDRIYLNAYVPILQTSAQVVAFLSGHLGFPFPSPALFRQMGDRFRRAVMSFADANDIPWISFGKDEAKLEVMAPHLARQADTGKSGVAAVGVAQEFQRVWTASEAKTSTGTPRWSFNVEIIFARKIRRDTKGVFRTAIDRRDNGGVLVNVFYKHSRIKQYLKDGRAMRIETVVNAPRDLGCNARLPNLDELQAKARAANRRILEAERAGQGTVLASPAFERIAHPTADAEGRRTPALRFGDPRVMALAGALCQTLLAATGFTNKNLRVLIAGLLGSTYTPGQMTYDLRRLRLNGLIRRLPHTNRYVLTDDGIRIAVFYTKVYNRLLVPLTAANQPQAPPDLRAALAAITRHVDDYANRARLPRAA